MSEADHISNQPRDILKYIFSYIGYMRPILAAVSKTFAGVIAGGNDQNKKYIESGRYTKDDFAYMILRDRVLQMKPFADLTFNKYNIYSSIIKCGGEDDISLLYWAKNSGYKPIWNEKNICIFAAKHALIDILSWIFDYNDNILNTYNTYIIRDLFRVTTDERVFEWIKNKHLIDFENRIKMDFVLSSAKYNKKAIEWLNDAGFICKQENFEDLFSCNKDDNLIDLIKSFMRSNNELVLSSKCLQYSMVCGNIHHIEFLLQNNCEMDNVALEHTIYRYNGFTVEEKRNCRDLIIRLQKLGVKCGRFFIRNTITMGDRDLLVFAMEEMNPRPPIDLDDLYIIDSNNIKECINIMDLLIKYKLIGNKMAYNIYYNLFDRKDWSTFMKIYDSRLHLNLTENLIKRLDLPIFKWLFFERGHIWPYIIDIDDGNSLQEEVSKWCKAAGFGKIFIDR